MHHDRKSSKIVNVAFKLLYEIETKGESYPVILTVCQIAQIFTIIAFLTINTIGAELLFSNKVSTFLNINSLVLAIFSLVTMLILMAIFLINYHLYNQLGTLHRFTSIVDIGNIISTIIVYTAESLYYFLGIYLFWKINGGSSGFEYWNSLLLLFGTPLYLVQSAIFVYKRPYGLLSVLIAPLCVLFSMSIVSSILLLATVVVRCRQLRKLNKLFYTLVGCTCIWCFVQTNYNTDGQYYLSSINLILIITCCIGIFFFHPLHANRSALQNDKMLLNFYKLRKNVENSDRTQHQQINLQEEEMYEQYFEETAFLRQAQPLSQPRNLTFQKWKKQNMEQALWSKIKWDKDNHHTDFDLNLFYFVSGMQLKRNVLALMREMIDYFNKNKSTYNFFKNYQMYKVANQIFHSYQHANLSNDTNLQIADIIQAEQHYHNFYRIIKLLLQQIIDYWKELAHVNFLLNPEIQSQLCHISSLHHNLRQLVKKLQGYPIREELRLFGLISKLVSNYETGKDIDLQGKTKNQRINSFESLMLQGETIERMSLKLLRQLSYQRMDIESHSVRSIIPHNFHLYLEEIYRGFLERDEHGSFVLPLLHNDGCFVLKRCRLYMLPPSDAGVKMLLTLELEKDSGQFFLYDAIRQRIEYFSDGMSQLMGISTNKVKMLINGEKIFFPSDLFEVSLSAGQMDVLINDNTLKTNIKYEGFHFKKNHRYNYNNDVTLNLSQEFKFQNYDYKVINVVSESFKTFKLEEEQRDLVIVTNQTKERTVHEEYANEVFFCRIQNPYKSKIVQKVSNIHHRSYRSYFYQVTLIKLVLLAVILTNFAVFRYMNNKMIANGSTIAQTMYNLNNEYINLLRMYSNCYSNVLFTRDPRATMIYIGSTFYPPPSDSAISPPPSNSSFFPPAPNRNFTPPAPNSTFTPPPPASILKKILNNLTRYYDEHNDLYSKNIKQTYLLYKNLGSHAQINYQLYYGNFNITTSTEFTNFYDFIISMEEGFADNSNIPFFASNYNSILSIMPVYEQYQRFSSDYNCNYFIANVAGLVFALVVGVLIMYTFIVTCKMIELHRDIKQLYKFIDHSDTDKVIQSLISIKTSVGTINHESDNNETYEQLMNKREFLSSRQNTHKTGDDKVLQAETDEQNKVGRKGNIQNGCRLLLFGPLLAIYIGILLYFQNSNMQCDQTDFYNILKLLQKFQIDEMVIQRNYVDLFQPTYYKELYGPYTNPYQNGTIIKNQFKSSELPHVFQGDLDKEESLCQSVYLNSITIPLFSLNQSQSACASIQSGILQKGYSSSLQMLQSNIRIQSKSGFNAYLSPKVKGISNNMLMIIFTRELLTNYIKVKVNNFFGNLEQHKIDSANEDTQLIGIGLCAAVGVLIALIYTLFHLRRQMHIVINLVCIIPNSAMFSIRMTSFIRKENILAKIDQL